VKAVYRERLAPFARFRQRVVERGFPIATPHWQDVPHFEIGQNLHHVALPAPYDLAALTALIEDLASTPLDRERPLWQVHVIDGVARGSALVMRFHHCIADGTAGWRSSGRSSTPDPWRGSVPPRRRSPPRRPPPRPRPV